MKKNLIFILLFWFSVIGLQAQKTPTSYVNPFLGMAILWDSVDIGYRPTHRTWGAEVFPRLKKGGSSLSPPDRKCSR